MTTSEPITPPATTFPCWICGGPATKLPAYSPLSLFHCPACDFGFQPPLDSEQIREASDIGFFDSYGNGHPYDNERQRRHEARIRLRLIARHARNAVETHTVGFGSDLNPVDLLKICAKPPTRPGSGRGID